MSNLIKYAENVLKNPLYFVNGKFTKNTSSTKDINILNPSNGKVLKTFQSADNIECDNIIQNSKKTFQSWSLKSPFERGKILINAANILKSRIDEIAYIETLNNGKTFSEAKIDVLGCIDTLQFFGGISGSINGEYVQLENGSFGYTIREPYGVIGAIGAWNYPFQIAVWKSAPALVCGNTMVYKPSPLTPITATLLAEIYCEAGLPDGAFNVVQGGAEVGEILCTHSDISKITFTGSVNTGEKIMTLCAKNIKPSTLELGGKSPLIIFEDCDINEAIEGILMANFLSQGQVCSNASRVYIHKNIYNDLVDKLIQRVKNLKVGDPFKKETKIGASISKQHMLNVKRFIDVAVQQGANVLVGGEIQIFPGDLENGFYMSPCVLSNVNNDSLVAKDEIFGAVAVLFKFETEDIVVDIANDTQLRLAAGLFTKDMQRAHRVASKLKFGSIFINNYNITPPQLPFGGVAKSGIGRENGTHAIHHNTNVKSVYVEMGRIDCPLSAT